MIRSSVTHNKNSRGADAMLVAKRIALLFLAFNLANAAPEVALAQENLQKKNFSIKALPINEALHEFSKQSGVQVMFLSESDEQFYSQEITGSYTFYEAMQQMLEGTVLKVQYVNEKIIRIDGPKEKRPGQKDEPRGRKIYLSEPPDKIGYISDGAPMRVASVSAGEEGRSGGSQGSESSSGVSSSTPEILVLGSKLLNMDIRRTEDDPQPYVVLDREEIERTSAGSVDELLRQRLTSTTGAVGSLQDASGSRGGLSQINLRGLGPEQTLILVDGRRLSSVNMSGGAGGGSLILMASLFPQLRELKFFPLQHQAYMVVVQQVGL